MKRSKTKIAEARIISDGDVILIHAKPHYHAIIDWTDDGKSKVPITTVSDLPKPTKPKRNKTTKDKPKTRHSEG